ncbi:sensor histidine kinase [Lysinibacillus sp. NPDC093197]|uniref:sensor histidine kinase n=1 Tax=Lysinibacillus sp. NPDC093197 TaxID=3364132 RepID=UPI003827C475
MISYSYFEMVNNIFNWSMQFCTAYFFYRFCRIFIQHSYLLIISIGYFITVIVLEWFIGDISNFGVYLFASLTAFLLLLPLKNNSVYLKFFIVITYFSIRWMAPTIVIILYRPISDLSLYLVEKWIIPHLFDVTIGYFSYTIWMMLVLLALYIIGLWCVIHFYEKCIHMHPRIFENREILLLILPPLIGMSSYFMMNKYHQVIGDPIDPDVIDQFLKYWGVHNCIIIAAMFGVLILVQKLDLQRVQQQKQLVLVNQSQQLQAHLQSIDALYKDMQLLKHDVKNHSATVERLIETKQLTEASIYLNSMQQQMDSKVTQSVTGHAIVDLLIQEKIKKAQAQSVVIESTFTYPSYVHCDVYDLCIILHNALDNALTATKDRPSASISIHSIQHKCTYILTIKNPIPAFVNENNYQGGLGLQIIQDIAKKYNGDIQINTDHQVFELHVLLHFHAQL